MLDKSCKEILVRGVNWIGDSVMTMPALKALRRSLPEARISILVKPWVSPLFKNNPDIDEVILYEDEHMGLRGKIRLSRVLRRKKFCAAILFQNAFDAALLTFLSGVKTRAGYRTDGRGFLLSDPVPVPPDIKNSHEIYYYLNLLGSLGLDAAYSDPYIRLSLEERLQARGALSEMKRPLLGLNPGATYGSAKRWFPERFAEIGNWFINETGGSVVIYGGTQEVDIAEEIYKRVPDHGLLLAGRTSLRDLVGLISESDVIVTNDSGPMHIAYAVRTPQVAIFGSTDPRLTGPVGGENVVLTSDVACSPCFERTCSKADLNCMYAITTDDVYLGIKKLLPRNVAVFFDRDGTLCRDPGYMNSMDDFKVFPEIETLGLLKDRGFRLIGVTNQSGIARGSVGEEFVRQVNSIFVTQHHFDGFYYCPHHPEEQCTCRKPEPGMLFAARKEHGIDLRHSYVVGDKESDMILARSAGAKGILVQTGEVAASPHAFSTVRNLGEAVNVILNDYEGISPGPSKEEAVRGKARETG
jgi:heptosyltransferase-2